MSERDELAERVARAMWESDAWVPYEGIDADSAAEIALKEIERTHVLVPKDDARAWVECELDCHHEEDAVFNVLCDALS